MKSDAVYIAHILKNIQNIQRLAADGKPAFLADQDKQAAIVYYFKHLPSQQRAYPTASPRSIQKLLGEAFARSEMCWFTIISPSI